MRCVVGVAAIAAWAVGAPIAMGLSCPVISDLNASSRMMSESDPLAPALLPGRPIAEEIAVFGQDDLQNQRDENFEVTLSRFNLRALRAADMFSAKSKATPVIGIDVHW